MNRIIHIFSQSSLKIHYLFLKKQEKEMACTGLQIFLNPYTFIALFVLSFSDNLLNNAYARWENPKITIGFIHKIR